MPRSLAGMEGSAGFEQLGPTVKWQLDDRNASSAADGRTPPRGSKNGIVRRRDPHPTPAGTERLAATPDGSGLGGTAGERTVQ